MNFIFHKIISSFLRKRKKIKIGLLTNEIPPIFSIYLPLIQSKVVYNIMTKQQHITQITHILEESGMEWDDIVVEEIGEFRYTQIIPNSIHFGVLQKLRPHSKNIVIDGRYSREIKDIQIISNTNSTIQINLHHSLVWKRWD